MQTTVLMYIIFSACISVGCSNGSPTQVIYSDQAEDFLLSLDDKDSPVQRVVRDPDGTVVSLELGGMSVTEEQVDLISEFTGLTMLAITGHNINDDFMENIKNLEDLRILNVSSTEVTNDFVYAVIDVLSVELLNVDDTSVTEEVRAVLDQSPGTIKEVRGLPQGDWAR